MKTIPLLVVFVLFLIAFIYIIYEIIVRTNAYESIRKDDFVIVIDNIGNIIETYVVAIEPERICLESCGWVSKHDFIYGSKDGIDYLFDIYELS